MIQTEIHKIWREEIPNEIAEQYNRMPTDADWGTLVDPVDDYYARRPIGRAFKNWHRLLPVLHKGGFFTAFHSQRDFLTPRGEIILATTNDDAYKEVKHAEGFRGVYIQGRRGSRDGWFFDPDLNLGYTPNFLSGCFFATRADARNAAQSLTHQLAADRLSDYNHGTIETHETWTEKGRKTTSVIWERISRHHLPIRRV